MLTVTPCGNNILLLVNAMKTSIISINTSRVTVISAQIARNDDHFPLRFARNVFPEAAQDLETKLVEILALARQAFATSRRCARNRPANPEAGLCRAAFRKTSIRDR